MFGTDVEVRRTTGRSRWRCWRQATRSRLKPLLRPDAADCAPESAVRCQHWALAPASRTASRARRTGRWARSASSAGSHWCSRSRSARASPTPASAGSATTCDARGSSADSSTSPSGRRPATRRLPGAEDEDRRAHHRQGPLRRPYLLQVRECRPRQRVTPRPRDRLARCLALPRMS